MKPLKLLLICIIWLSISGCNSADNEDTVTFEKISKGTQSGIGSQKLLVVRNDSQLHALWSEYTLNMPSIPEEPIVDFENDILVAAFIGYTPTPTCFSTVDITSVNKTTTSVVVHVSIKVPSTEVTCVVAEQPFEIIKLPRVDNYIELNVEVSKYDL